MGSPRTLILGGLAAVAMGLAGAVPSAVRAGNAALGAAPATASPRDARVVAVALKTKPMPKPKPKPMLEFVPKFVPSSRPGAGAAARRSLAAAAFERLSPADQTIALALFDAQGTGSDGAALWGLDRISAAGLTGMGWGRIFKEMRRRGLLDAKTLGAVVSRFRQGEQLSPEIVTASAGDAAHAPVPGAAGVLADAAPGAGVLADGEIGGAGSFKRLSPENRRIARALLEAQRPAPGGAPAWSLDRLAAARKAAGSWAEVCAELRRRGFITATGLGEVVRRYRDRRAPVIGASQIVLTTGKGTRIVVPSEGSTAPDQARHQARGERRRHAQRQARRQARRKGEGAVGAGKAAVWNGRPAGSSSLALGAAGARTRAPASGFRHHAALDRPATFGRPPSLSGGASR